MEIWKGGISMKNIKDLSNDVLKAQKCLSHSPKNTGNVLKNKFYPKGSIVFVDLGDGLDSEQSGFRPCVIVQNNVGNKYSSTTVVAPISRKLNCSKDDSLPVHFKIENYKECGLHKSSTVLCEQLKAISKRRIRSSKPLGAVDIKKLNECLAISLGLTK